VLAADRKLLIMNFFSAINSMYIDLSCLLIIRVLHCTTRSSRLPCNWYTLHR
jgi:hypothetical protein